MKKLFLIVALALSISVANAWNRRADEGVVLLAEKHLTAEAKAMLNKYLGDSYLDDVHYLYDLEERNAASYTKSIHYLHLDKNLQPAKVEGNNVLVEIESAMQVVRNHKSQSKEVVATALRTVINLMCDIHNLSNVRIEGVPHSSLDFKFTWYKGDVGKRKATAKISWAKFWDAYSNWHTGFSGSLWAEDLELSLGSKRAEFSKGSLNDWASEIGGVANGLYARINPEYEMTRRERNELENLSCEMMARAGYRLAVLLNEAVK